MDASQPEKKIEKGKHAHAANSGSKSKGQSSIEFIITYGWIALIIGIAIVVISTSPLFFKNFYSRYCYGPPGFTCLQPVFTASSSNISIAVIQASGLYLTVKNIACSTSFGQVSPTSTQWRRTNIGIPSGTQTRLSVVCYQGDTTQPYSARLGATVSFVVWVNATSPLLPTPLYLRFYGSTIAT